MNPSILHFSRTGSILKMLFFLGVAAIAFAVAGLMHAEREAPPQTLRLSGMELPAPAPHRDPLVPLKMPLLIVAGGACLFYAGRHGLRAVTREVAARTEGGRLHLHSSYGAEADPLPVEAIADAIFDRADRLPGDASGPAKLGARLRHGLYLRYRAGGATRELRLIDNDIDGGTEQLRRFAAHLDAWRQSRRTPESS
ncbi:MAG TPA: hypothetical protein VN047_08785 [Sphingopyxis sp.]|uniref:hypothetical protein n=1 Tax=Sphingopyxis sp. TaxID=1908224 RepID=UPI002B55ACA8|nr:hypothetical protein [Sphingopyxis sp.]HWW56973.1 hypothetical protein [Sphingopyxis sp.]